MPGVPFRWAAPVSPWSTTRLLRRFRSGGMRHAAHVPVDDL